MPVNITRSSYDTLVNELAPNTNYGDWNKITLCGGPTGQRRYSYLYFPGIPPAGSTVISATLRFWLQGSSWAGGPHTITARRLGAGWKESLLTWNRKGSLGEDSGNSSSTAVTGGTDKQLVEIDVSLMLADVANGAYWGGIRLDVDTADGVARRIYSSEAHPDLRPRLEVSWNRSPLAPVDLSPSGDRSVSLSHPVLSWVFKDREGDEQAEFQVQLSTSSAVDSAGAFTTPEYDSGWVPSGDGQYNLADPFSRDMRVVITSASPTITTSVGEADVFDAADVGATIAGPAIPAGTTIIGVVSPTEATMSANATASDSDNLVTITRGYAGLVDGATRFWIVRTRDVPGQVSPFSAVQSFRRDVNGTLTIDSPINGGTVDETTPAITTTLTGRAQEAIAYSLEEDDGTGRFRTVWSIGRFAADSADGVPFTFTIPNGKIRLTGRQYRVTVHSWDTIDRESTPGDPAFRWAQATFTFVRSATPSPVTSLTVVDETPGVKLTWNRGVGVANPDFYCLVVDGVRVYDRLDPVDFSQGGDPIVYSMVWYSAKPNVEHTFEVEAVVLDLGTYKHSQGNAAQVFTPNLVAVGGTWIVDDDAAPYLPGALPRRVRIRGAEEPDLQIGESSSVFYPIGRRDPVYIVDSIRGLEGGVSGVVEAEDPAGSGFLENFTWLKTEANVGRPFRLIFGDVNIPVQLGKASDTHLDSHLRRHQVSIEVSQISEFE